jgi:hypothetical protein
MTQLGRHKVVFLHIAKTGGISFRRILQSLYQDSFCVCKDPTIPGIAATIAKFDAVELHSIRTAQRDLHLQGELIRQRRTDLLDGAEVFTMLRDPVDHAISTYYYGVQQRGKFESFYSSSNWSFPESLEAFVDMSDGLNGQVANLVGKYWGMDGEKTREDLELAKAMLVQKRVHVGLTERFPDSVRILQKVIGRQILDQMMPLENRNHNRPTLEAVPERLKQRIRDRSQLDQELYDFGKKLFLTELERYGPKLSGQFTKWSLDSAGLAAWSNNTLNRLFREPLKSAILHDLEDNKRKRDSAASQSGLF